MSAPIFTGKDAALMAATTLAAALVQASATRSAGTSTSSRAFIVVSDTAADIVETTAKVLREMAKAGLIPADYAPAADKQGEAPPST